MKAPDVIYVEFSEEVNLAFEKQPFEETPAYIRKDILLEKVKELRDDAGSRDDHYEKDAIIEYNAYEAVMDIIKSM